jgi:hypothetical protein
VKLLVVERFKGVVTDTVDVTTGLGLGDCSRGPLGKGHSYLIYAWSVSKDSELFLALCSGTRPFPDEQDRASYHQRHARELELLRKLAKRTRAAAP